ncbi:MAG TPA: hypothetical protein VNG33_15565 [Polyangiaceae bacterium]|nr:hypothetical protein [Polyangiaceae bacterium]
MGQAVSNDALPFAAAIGTFSLLLGASALSLLLPPDVRVALGLLAVGTVAVAAACVAVVGRWSVRFPWVSFALVFVSAPLFIAPSTISFNPRAGALATYFVGAVGIWLAVVAGKRTRKETKSLDRPALFRRRVIGLLVSILAVVVAAIPIVDVAADRGAPVMQEGLVTDVEHAKHAYDPYVVSIGELRFRRADPMPRVDLGDRVRVVIRPGALGLAWVSRLELLQRAP